MTESVPAPRSTLWSGSTRWSCAPGTTTRVSSVADSGGATSSSSFASEKRFSASLSGSMVGYSKDEAVAVGAARKAVLRSGGRRTGREAARRAREAVAWESTAGWLGARV
jgi:hypothetical protein